MFAIGLYTDEVPSNVPPHRMPRNWTSLPDVIAKTGDPLSPAPTPALTWSWQRSALRDPRTRMSTHVAVTWPWVQPVVRPTLFTTCPTRDGPSLTMRNAPEIVRDPPFAAVVFAMNPWSAVTPEARWLYALSLYRHRCPARPIGHFIASHAGSAISVPIRFPVPVDGWKCCVPVTCPCTSVQWEFTTKPLTPARTPLKPRVHR